MLPEPDERTWKIRLDETTLGPYSREYGVP
jgi:hypothetical protein